MYECEIEAVHLSSESNRLADNLSRWHIAETRREKFLQLTKDFVLKEWQVSDKML